MSLNPSHKKTVAVASVEYEAVVCETIAEIAVERVAYEAVVYETVAEIAVESVAYEAVVCETVACETVTVEIVKVEPPLMRPLPLIQLWLKLWPLKQTSWTPKPLTVTALKVETGTVDYGRLRNLCCRNSRHWNGSTRS